MGGSRVKPNINTLKSTINRGHNNWWSNKCPKFVTGGLTNKWGGANMRAYRKQHLDISILMKW